MLKSCCYPFPDAMMQSLYIFDFIFSLGSHGGSHITKVMNLHIYLDH